MNVENFSKRKRDKTIMENIGRGRTTKTWKETIKNDMKRRNLILEMLKIEGSGDVAADWWTLTNRHNGQALKLQIEMREKTLFEQSYYLLSQVSLKR